MIAENIHIWDAFNSSFVWEFNFQIPATEWMLSFIPLSNAECFSKVKSG